MSALDPDIAASASLFEGQPRDRDLLTAEENANIDKDIRHLLRLLSPHLQSRAAQECIDGLLHRYHVHRWNVDDLLACSLPYHDSPLFTRLLQGLHVEGKAQWDWLTPLKQKPATLVRSTLAKYCSKDLSVLTVVGNALQETIKLHKANRALATFFAALWLDTLAATGFTASDLVEAAVPPVLSALRRPLLRDSFHAALTVVAGLSIKVQLDPTLQGQFLERAARQVAAEQGRPAATLMALLLQLQVPEELPLRALRSFMSAGPQAVLKALPRDVDCENLLVTLVDSCLFRAATDKDEDQRTQFQALVEGILADNALIDSYAAPLARAAFQACCHALNDDPEGKERVATALRGPLAALDKRQPAALAAAFKQAAGVFGKCGLGTETLLEVFEAAGGGVVAGEGMTPVVDALMHGTPDVKVQALGKAVELLGKEDEAPRQRLLASMALQAAEDESMEVALAALGRETLWNGLPAVEALAAARMLESLLAQRLGVGTAERGLASVLKDARSVQLLPPVLRCLAWVYGRTDCGEALRHQMDAALLPFLLLCLLAKQCSQELEAAVLEFCAASQHALLALVTGSNKAKPTLEKLAQAVDASSALGLCCLSEAKAWPLPEDSCPLPPPAVPFGGVAGQVKAAELLARALPRLFANLKGSEAEQLATRCTETCCRLAAFQCDDVLSRLLQATLVGLCDAEAARTLAALQQKGAKGRRRKSGAGITATTTAAPDDAFQHTALGLLRLSLSRPRSFAQVLQRGLSTHLQLLQPVLLRLALGHEKSPTAASNVACAHALLLLRSLLLSPKAPEWAVDQSLLLPLVAKLASAEASEVRAAALEVAGALKGAEGTFSWSSPMAAALREAGVFRPQEAVLSTRAWAVAEEPGFTAKTLASALEQLAAHKWEILQDCSGVSLALSKALVGKNRAKSCGSWGLGLSMLVQDVDDSLLPAIPAAGLLSSLHSPLQLAVQDSVARLEEAAPALLRTAAVRMLGLAGQPALEKPKAVAAAEEAARAFLQEVALPFCRGLAEYWEGAGKVCSESVADLAILLCKSSAKMASSSGEAGLRRDISMALFKLCVASSTAAYAVAGNVVSAASAALGDAQLDAPLLRGLLMDFPAFKGPQLESDRGRVAAELLCKQVVGLKGVKFGPDAGGDQLVLALADAAKQAAGQRVTVPADDDKGGALEQLLLAVAAMGQHLEAALTEAADSELAGKVASTVCGAVADVCEILGQRLSAGVVLAAARVCGALAPLSPASEARDPAPFRCCLKALSCFSQPLRPDMLSMLKIHLQQLWKCPKPVADEVVEWETLAQARLRRLLHTLVLGRSGMLVKQVDVSFCLSLAQSAGECASLDWVMLLHLARRGPLLRATKKSKKQKRRGAGDPDEEMLQEVLPPQDENSADEVLEMLLSLGSGSRYQCFGTLMQTLSTLALGLCPPAGAEGYTLPWGPALLPQTFWEDVEQERAFWVLQTGLEVACRFVSEHGLPDALDGTSIDTCSFRATVVADEEKLSAEAVPMSLCYAGLCACVTEVVLEKAGPPGKRACTEAQQLRTLLLRSLAVNHPLTFFRCLCLTLRVPDFCPANGGLLAHESFTLSHASHTMAVSCQALKDAQEMTEVADAETKVACASFCVAAMRCCGKSFLSGAASTWQDAAAIVAWQFQDTLLRIAGTHASAPVVEFCVPAVARCLRERARGQEPSVRVTVECCKCLETAVTQLGKGLLEHLKVMLEPLLDCTESVKQEQLLHEQVLHTLNVLVKALGAFLSPFLERLLSITSAPAPAWRTNLLEQLGRELVASVPHRLLLPAVHAASAHSRRRLDEAAPVEDCVVRLQRCAAMCAWLLASATPEAVAGDIDGLAAALMQMLSSSASATCALLRAGAEPEELPVRLRHRVLPSNRNASWEEACAEASVPWLDELGAGAFAQFALRLEVEQLQPQLARLAEWARRTQARTLERQVSRKGPTEPLEDAQDVSRLLAFCAVLRSLTAEAPAVAEELLLPLAAKDLAAGLSAARRCALQLTAELRPSLKKRRRTGVATGPRTEVLAGRGWWWFEAATAALRAVTATMQPSKESTSQSKAVEDALDALQEPSVDLMDVCEYLPAVEESELATAFVQTMQAALVAQAGACDGTRMKRHLSLILGKSRADDVEVRLCAVRSCHKIWVELGVQAAAALSEVVIFAAELLEDEDPRVEATVRLLIKTMEDCTGQSLQDALKH